MEARLLAMRNSGGAARLQRPSMGQDMQKGRRTEIDFINGFIVDKGREIGRPAPTHAALVEVVKRVARGEIPPRPENVVDAAAGLPR